MSFTEILQELPKLTEAERQELREWLDGYDPALESEWVRIAKERISQIDGGVEPLDGYKVLEEMRQLAKHLARQRLSSFIRKLAESIEKPSFSTAELGSGLLRQ